MPKCVRAKSMAEKEGREMETMMSKAREHTRNMVPGMENARNFMFVWKMLISATRRVGETERQKSGSTGSGRVLD